MSKLQADQSLGLIPLMAGCSSYPLGALNAESFCERILSQANNVMTSGNTLLSDEELEMIVILRMNRDFMKFMRKHYADISLQTFKMTVLDTHENDEGDSV